MREWIGILILLALGWLVLLTAQTADLYHKYCALVNVNHTTREMVIEHKAEVNKQIEQTQHDIVVHEQMCEALIKGREEW